MIQKIFIVISIILLPVFLVCQKPLECYSSLLETGKEAIVDKDFDLAIQQFEAAKDCPELAKDRLRKTKLINLDQLIKLARGLKPPEDLLIKQSQEQIRMGIFVGKMTDPRDKRTYRTIRVKREVGLGVYVDHTWMAENLNFEQEQSYCLDNKRSNCNIYGRLYTLKAAQKACPPGWHLPSRIEWQRLMHQVEEGGLMNKNKSKLIYDKLKAGGIYGFDALLAGGRYADGYSPSIGMSGSFWTSSIYEAEENSYHIITISEEGLYSLSDNVSSRIHCRCVKNDNKVPISYDTIKK